MCILHVFELRYELGQINRITPIIRNGPLFRYRIVIGQFHFELLLLSPITTVLNVSRESLLIKVEIERGDALSGFKEGYDDVHGKSGFAAATLVISHNHDVRRRMR